MVSQTNALQSTTQKYLEIFDITNDVLILQDGSCSLVLKTSAINFDLFSEEEQDATIYAYAALLNSLSFPIEIVIRSQKKDVTAYIDLLKTQESKAYSPTQKKQIRDYRAFVEQLVQERNVLEKRFYMVVTISALELGVPAAASVVPGQKKNGPAVFDKYQILEKALAMLQPRRDHLMHQLARIGLYSEQLKTQELIQLFYSIYNPEASKGQKIVNTNDYTTPLVTAQLRTPPPAAGQAQPNTGDSRVAPTPDITQAPMPTNAPSTVSSLAEQPAVVAPPAAAPMPTPPAPLVTPNPSPVASPSGISESIPSDLQPPTPPPDVVVTPTPPAPTPLAEAPVVAAPVSPEALVTGLTPPVPPTEVVVKDAGVGLSEPVSSLHEDSVSLTAQAPSDLKPPVPPSV